MTTTDWDAYAGTYRQLVDESTVPPLLAGVMSASSGTMIDVGCGDGILLDLIRSTFARTWKIQGFEISPARAEIARGRGHEVLADEHGDVPAPSGTFDLVTSTHVIEHAPDDHAYATELARLVRPGGLVYVETPVKLEGRGTSAGIRRRAGSSTPRTYGSTARRRRSTRCWSRPGWK